MVAITLHYGPKYQYSTIFKQENGKLLRMNPLMPEWGWDEQTIDESNHTTAGKLLEALIEWERRDKDAHPDS